MAEGLGEITIYAFGRGDQVKGIYLSLQGSLKADRRRGILSPPSAFGLSKERIQDYFFKSWPLLSDGNVTTLLTFTLPFCSDQWQCPDWWGQSASPEEKKLTKKAPGNSLLISWLASLQLNPEVECKMPFYAWNTATQPLCGFGPMYCVKWGLSRLLQRRPPAVWRWLTLPPTLFSPAPTFIKDGWNNSWAST